jgi:hypothetical protein
MGRGGARYRGGPLHRDAGPTGDGFVRTSSGGWTVGEEFTVFVIARDVPDALERVRRVGADIELLGDPMPQALDLANDA